MVGFTLCQTYTQMIWLYKFLAQEALRVIDEQVLDEAVYALDQAGLSAIDVELTTKNVLVRVANSESQLQAKAVLSDALGDKYVTALNLAPTTPDWLTNLGAGPMKLGLDLSVVECTFYLR